MATTAQGLSEEELVRRIQRGDEAAFDSLMELCGPRVYNIAYRMVGNHEDAEDMAQEAFVRMYRAIPKFDWRASFTTWMYRIITNACLDELNRRQRRPALLNDVAANENFDMENMPHSGPQPEEYALTRERQHELQRALNTLPDKHRMLVLLYDIQGLSYQQISSALGMNLGTVKSRLNRARIALRESISQFREQLVENTSLSNQEES